MLRILTALLLFALVSQSIAGEVCCTINTIDTERRVVTATELATSRTFSFAVSNTALLADLRPGMSFDARGAPGGTQFSLMDIADVTPDYAEICCTLVGDLTQTATLIEARDLVLPAAGCCEVVSSNAATGIVTARDVNSGQTYSFQVESRELLTTLNPGTVFGPTNVPGVSASPEDLEPDWQDVCCPFTVDNQGRGISSTALATACCKVVSTNTETGAVTARDASTGRTYSFQVESRELLTTLNPGTVFGPTSVPGVSVSPEDLEPDWADVCCPFTVDSQGSISSTTAGITAVGQHSLVPGVMLEVLSLRRLGPRVVKVEISVSNSTSERVDFRPFSVGEFTNLGVWSLSNLALIDYVGGTKYRVVRDGEGECACIRGSANLLPWLDPGESKTYWAHFTAPPSDVATVSLEIPGAVSLDGIAIQP